MLKFWKIVGGPTLFFDAPDSGGGGGAADEDAGDEGGGGGDEGGHPEFQIPAGVGAGDEGEGAADSGGDGSADDDQGGEAGRAGGKRTGQPEMIAKYRYDEVNQRFSALTEQATKDRAELARLRAVVAGALGITDPSKPVPRELGEREKAIKARLEQLFPELAVLRELAEQKDGLLGLAKSAPEFQRQNKAFWDRVATNMLDGVESAIAPLLLGEGKTAKDMNEKARARWRMDFVSWVDSDPRRVDRYQALDRTLIDEYREEIEETTVNPLRRQFGAGTIKRASAAARLPVGGSSSAPVSTGKKTTVPKDEDAAADAAWKNLQERLNATA